MDEDQDVDLDQIAGALACAHCRSQYRRSAGSHSLHCSLRCRFLSKIDIADSGCWVWTGAQDGRGYGQMSINRKPRKAHRISYEIHVGPIPEGLQIDHLCRNRLCVNPQHLEPVTNRQNALRGESPQVITYRTGICQKGHSMGNAIIKPNGARTCRTCENDRQRSYRRSGKAS